MNIGRSLQGMLDTVVSIAPKLVIFLVILVVGWIVAKLLSRVLDKLLNRVGFDRLIARSGMQRWIGSYDPSQLLSKLVYYAVLLFTLQLAFGVFGPNPVSDIITAIVAFLPRAFVALLIVMIAAGIAGAVKDVITSALGGLSYSRMLGTIAQVFILGLGIIAALNQVGIAMTVTMPVLITILATIGGIAVVGVGGGLIQPMRDRWERMLAKAEGEAGNVKAQLDANASQKQQAFAQQQYASSQYAGQYGSQGQPAGQPAQGHTAAQQAQQQAQEASSATYRGQSYGNQ